MSEERRIAITVPALARVEGEGALEVLIEAGRIVDLKLRIYEPPRLFEKLLEGREYTEVPDMVARICGICPVAYQMSAVHAIEAILGIDPGPWVRAMRRVFYCGEWLESHSLHIHLLAAPDFLGFDNIAEMAKVHPDQARRGLRLQALGNELIKLFGARSVHPIGAEVGGFHHAPALETVTALRDRLRGALVDAAELVRWTAGFDFPHVAHEFTSVALRHPAEYPMNEGRIVSDRGLDIDIAEFENHFREHQIPHSTALHCLLDDKPYLVGPLARVNLNRDRFPGDIQALLDETGIRWPSANMFHSIVARSVEVYFAVWEALRLLDDYRRPDSPGVAQVAVAAGVGYGCTEAPRGLLWHRYRLNDRGEVVSARIVPPTSQNQARIEENLHQALSAVGLDLPQDRLRFDCERVIRNYDPCISCATHFLDLRLTRR
ncbi:MAG: nickel-dependent hydrogenase large subunit [Gammaproteobacteria bacterium]